MPSTCTAIVAYALVPLLWQVPVPDLRPGHVLVRIEASGVNPLDTKIRDGLAAHPRTSPPAVLGIDLAGSVEEVAEDVSAFAPDDRVYGMTGGVGGVPGSLAEHAVVDAMLLAHRPVAWTARKGGRRAPGGDQRLGRSGGPRRSAGGQRVLAQGGAGGVGHL